MMNPFLINEPTCISFSGGRTSGYMLWKYLEANNGLPDEAVVCFANTGKEQEDTLQFVKDCEQHWNVNIVWLEFDDSEVKFKVVNFDTASRNGEPFEKLIKKRKYLPNPVARFCTGELKILTIERYFKSMGKPDFATAVGIRADESRRAAKMKDKLTPLMAANVTQKDIQFFWKQQPFDLGLKFNNGVTPLGNCDLCFLKGGSQIVSLIADNPSRAIWWAKMESDIGGTWRSDRPSYSQMAKFTANQADMFSDETISCFCGD